MKAQDSIHDARARQGMFFKLSAYLLHMFFNIKKNSENKK